MTTLLYDALKHNNNEKQDDYDEEEQSNLREFDVSDKVNLRTHLKTKKKFLMLFNFFSYKN